MPCEPLKDGGFICGTWSKRERAPRCACGRRSTLLCDGPREGGDPMTTCDAPLCRRCAVTPAPGLAVLPDGRGGWPTPHDSAVRAQRLRSAGDREGAKGMRDLVEPDTRDFCPACAAALNKRTP